MPALTHDRKRDVRPRSSTRRSDRLEKMKAYAALLRAINVGGTGKLPMSDLRALCEEAGFTGVKTYIQSGNVVFRSRLGEASVRTKLEKAVAAKLGKPCSVAVRTTAELDAILRRNPFPKAAPNQVLVLFLHEEPPKDALNEVKIPAREELELAGREVFVHFPDGMGASKLKIPFAKTATGRNVNTVKKLAAMARAAEGDAS